MGTKIVEQLSMTKWLQWLKSVKWKNSRAEANSAYVPTPVEHCANVFTHGVFIPPSLFGCYALLQRCTSSQQILAAALYGISLILLFTVSTCFHSVFFCYQRGNLKDVLHRCDRAVIYIFIAGSYFPWTVLLDFPSDSLAAHVCWFIWVLATCGIAYQQIFHERYKTVETLFYCCMGVLPSLILTAQCTNMKGYQQMRIGGILYLVGVFFFKADGRIPCAHAIWHCFVAAAAAVHYLTIAYYLFPDPEPDPALHSVVDYIGKIEL